MPGKIIELVIAAETSAVLEALVTGEHRRHWHPDLGADDRDIDGYGAEGAEAPPASDNGPVELDEDGQVAEDLNANALRWHADLDDHSLTLLIAPMGYSTNITAIVTVPGMLGAVKLPRLAQHHESQLKRLRLLVENGSLDGYVFRGPDDPPTYRGDSSED